MVYAVVRAGGRQEKVEVGTIVVLDRQQAKIGDEIELPAVLFVDGDAVTTDADKLAKVTVTAEVLGEATPEVIADHRNAPVNALGYLRAMFAVTDIRETLDRLLAKGAALVGEVVNYQDYYLLCYVRGPEGILIGLAEQLEKK